MHDTITVRLPDGCTRLFGTNDKEMQFQLRTPQDKEALTGRMADFLIETYEKRIMKQVIESKYCYLSPMEKVQIVQKALSICDNTENTVKGNIFYNRRKKLVMKDLADYFQSFAEMSAEGFARFRLQEYKKELEAIADSTVDEFLTQRDYDDFIALLQYFVAISEPEETVVHVIYHEGEGYRLYNGEMEDITEQSTQDFMEELARGEHNNEDVLISALITLAPKKILMHGVTNKEIRETIVQIFAERVVICKSAHLI